MATRSHARSRRRIFGSVSSKARRVIGLLALALALLAGGALAVSPEARATVARWFSPFHGIVIIFNPPLPTPTPTPVGASLHLGQRLSLHAAQMRVTYHIGVPTSAGLRSPDEVYLGGQAPGGMVSVVYRARAGLPRAPGTGVGLLLTEFRGDLRLTSIIFAKGLEPGTHLERIVINGTTGYWITGKPHLFWYTGADGSVRQESVRLAGNVLLWERNGLVLRLEAALPQAMALRIAASTR